MTGDIITEHETVLTPEEITGRLDSIFGQTLEIIKLAREDQGDESAGVYWRAIHQMALLGRAYISLDPASEGKPIPKPQEPPHWQPILQEKARAYVQAHPHDPNLKDLAEDYFTPDRHAHLHSLDFAIEPAIAGLAEAEIPGAVAMGIVSILEPEDIPDHLKLDFTNAQA